MTFQPENLMNLSVANRDFGRVCRRVKDKDFVIIQKYGEPALLIMDIEKMGEALEKMGFALYEK